MTTVLLREVFSEKNQQHYPGIVSCGVIPSINFTSPENNHNLSSKLVAFFVFLKAGWTSTATFMTGMKEDNLEIII